MSTIEDKFNKDYEKYYRIAMSQQPLGKVQRLYNDIKDLYNKTDEEMTIKLWDYMREIQLKYYPGVFKTREELWRK